MDKKNIIVLEDDGQYNNYYIELSNKYNFNLEDYYMPNDFFLNMKNNNKKYTLAIIDPRYFKLEDSAPRENLYKFLDTLQDAKIPIIINTITSYINSKDFDKLQGKYSFKTINKEISKSGEINDLEKELIKELI